MGRLGYRAANVGERDLALGYERFQERTAGATFPFLSSNIVRKDTGEPVFDPFVVVEVERAGKSPLRVGVVGVVRFNPIFLKAGPEGTNLAIARPEDQLKKFVPKLRKQADLIVLLAALHLDDARRMVAEIPGVDVVIGSYGGMYNTRDEREGNTWLVYSGNQGKRLGETRVYLDGEGRGVEATTYLHFLTTRYPLDEEWSAEVADILREAREAREAATRTSDDGRDPAGSPVEAAGSASR